MESVFFKPRIHFRSKKKKIFLKPKKKLFGCAIKKN